MIDLWSALTVIVFAAFIVDWLAVSFSWKKVERITKPLAMLLVIFWTLMAADWTLDNLVILLLMAQLFGLAGDIFLLLPSRWFLAGLGAFLIGHLFYICMMVWKIVHTVGTAGFNDRWVGWLLLSFTIWVAMLLLFYRIIAPKSPRITMPLGLWVPIQFYGWVLSGLVVMSMWVLIIEGDLTKPVSFLLLGTLLFFVSDSLLAYDRFKHKMPGVRVWVMITYHLAQFSLAVGFLSMMGFFGGGLGQV